MTSTATVDERDQAILSQRAQEFDKLEGPREGDYVRFADGVERRISYVTPSAWLPEIDSIQTSDGGSWYLGNGYTSFSGALHLGVPRSTLTLTEAKKYGSVWFFHHDHRMAHNGVDVEIPFRVYECSEEATS